MSTNHSANKILRTLTNNFVRISFRDKLKILENFIIKYEDKGQAALELHHDSSEFTCLTALNDEFEGGGTWFHNQKMLAKNPTGGMTLHPGSITHLHGGRPITSGVRYIIVSFCRCDG